MNREKVVLIISLFLILTLIFISYSSRNSKSSDLSKNNEKTAVNESKLTPSPQFLGVKPALVDLDSYIDLSQEVQKYRKDRLITLDEFVKMSKEKNTIILDTRSNRMYEQRHIEGALHLDFTEFTQDNLAKLIPSKDTRILIYCNNNIEDDPINFASKMSSVRMTDDKKPLTLALNIPTFINLYGYGYTNIYELKELISITDSRINFSGTKPIFNTKN